ncbi:hypothetical protein BpHYR1_005016 [Brachionus plicatilis]|uniref:Uncharacterized protein n=1 Tax=Brachionus plicatilis TaxID=10195 RepID=A0A3M7Q3T3_BRAPC|nr:hypothetical protein BpHYR1_005016 [Brachionus plicatilis]
MFVFVTLLVAASRVFQFPAVQLRSMGLPKLPNRDEIKLQIIKHHDFFLDVSKFIDLIYFKFGKYFNKLNKVDKFKSRSFSVKELINLEKRDRKC